MEGNESIPTLGERLELLRRRWVYPATIIPACVLAALFLAFALKPLYRSTGTIILNTIAAQQKEVQQPQMTLIDQEFELVERRLMTRDNLISLVKKTDPYPGRPDLSLADKAEMVAQHTSVDRVDPVTLKPLAQSNAFSLHYDNPNPRRAAEVAREIVQMFLAYNQKTRQERATDTYRFLYDKSQQLSASIADMEGRIAQFKTKYGDALPDAQNYNQQSLARAQDHLNTVQSQLRLAQEKVSLLKVQLSQLSPTLVGAAMSTDQQLAQLRAQLAQDEQRYTPANPDIKRLKIAIRNLVQQQQAGQPGSAVKPDNPQYLAVQSQLQGAESGVAALQAEADRTEQQIDTYTHRLNVTPDVERKYAQLARNYKLAQDEYANIQQKLNSADLTKSLVADDQGERFALIRKPGVPSKPFSPNRLGIILLGMVLGVALGIGAAVFVEIGDPSVRGSRDLQELTGQSMIAAVPLLLNHADRRARRRRVGAIVTAYALALVVVSFTIAQAMK